jgi:hypothetical protein
MGKLQPGAVPRRIGKRFLTSFKKLVLGGVPPAHAARTLGIHRSTFYEWLRMVENAQNPDDVHPSLRDLSDIIEQAQSEAIAWGLMKAKAEVRSTTDALKWLAKVAPAEFGDQPEQKSDVTVNQIIIGLVREMNERNALVAQQAGVLDADFTEEGEIDL